jgi:dipeptide/tripeptide permease
MVRKKVRWTPMGLLDKLNPKATPKTVIKRSLMAALIGAAFFLLFKPSVREAWPIVLPIWVLLCAAIGALAEWQVSDTKDDDDHSDE